MEELRLEKSLEAEQKAVQDAISMTVKKRREEMESSYDSEIGKLQEKLKKIRARREKAKNQGMKDRIKEETVELHEHNRELRVRMKTLFQSQRVPSFCQSGFYLSLIHIWKALRTIRERAGWILIRSAFNRMITMRFSAFSILYYKSGGIKS